MNMVANLKNALFENSQMVKSVIANERSNGLVVSCEMFTGKLIDDRWQDFSKNLCRLLGRCVNKDGMEDELSLLSANLDLSAEELIGNDSSQKLSELYVQRDGLTNNEKIQLCFRTIERISEYFLEKKEAASPFGVRGNPQLIPFSQVG